MKRLRLDKRGVSNVIVVMLSLVLIVIIVGNVILWSYEMNQLDWERMQEKVALTNAEHITRSSWFTSTGEYVSGIGSRVSGTYSDTQAFNGSYETFKEALAPVLFNPSEYSLTGGTRYISGSIAELAASDGAYMVFRSYSSAFTGKALSAHQETTTIAGTSYYQMRLNSADTTGTSRDVLISTTGRKLWGRFVYRLNGTTEVPASTWTIYYRAYRTGPLPAVHCDIDILIRKADGAIAATIATNVANSPNLGTSWNTVSATYAWNRYVVADETDFLEVDFYAHVTTSQSNRRAYLRIDDSGVATGLQTRIENVMLPSEYTAQVELNDDSNTRDWQSLSWTAENAFTVSGVNVALQLYNSNTSEYPASGDGHMSYVSSSTPNTDETRNQTSSANTEHYRNSTSGWRIRITGTKATTVQFDLRIDWIEFKVKSQDSYRLDLDGVFTLDLSTYPRAYVDSVEMLVRYRTNDTLERWFVKAYNWTGQTYSDAGFNTTAGDTPMTEFKYYSVNLTTAWQDYVQSNGTIWMKFCDGSPDANQTTVDIDFIGVRAVIEGTKLSFQNSGSVTCHIVAIWILNATSHERYAADLFFNAGTSATYVRADIALPQSNFIAKVVTERGNVAVFTSN
jgi:hypothetical protein